MLSSYLFPSSTATQWHYEFAATQLHRFILGGQLCRLTPYDVAVLDACATLLARVMYNSRTGIEGPTQIKGGS